MDAMDNIKKSETPIVEIRHLKKYFKTKYGMLHAVDDINIDIKEGETLGVVGESGCGKSTLGRMLVRLEKETAGDILYKGTNICRISKKKIKDLRNNMQLIFQDPYSSLNPRMNVKMIISDPLIENAKIKDRKKLDAKVSELMDTVGLAERYKFAYPHELDGGRRQRIGIARALALDPEFIVCDEPVSALDVSIQAQILNLLMDLQEKHKLSYMFITHNMSVVKHISDRIMVMYLGQCVELASSDILFQNPLHPYTKALLQAIPRIDITKKGQKELIKGEVVTPINPKAGCRFASRCQYASSKCIGHDIPLKEIEEGHFVACTLFSE